MKPFRNENSVTALQAARVLRAACPYLAPDSRPGALLSPEDGTRPRASGVDLTVLKRTGHWTLALSKVANDRCCFCGSGSHLKGPSCEAHP